MDNKRVQELLTEAVRDSPDDLELALLLAAVEKRLQQELPAESLLGLEV